MSIPGDIIQLLRSSECAKISFTLCNIAIDGGGYKAVADKIDDGRIRVLTSPDVPPDSAIYERIRNVFIVNASISRTLIVHEATHAINDLKRKAIPAIDDEVVAHVAQALFYFIATGKPISALATDVGWKAISTSQECLAENRNCSAAAITAAADIAIDILRGRATLLEKLERLQKCILASPTYQLPQFAAGTIANYDGVGGYLKPIPSAWHATILTK